jgi:hypothetical protein
MATNHSKELRMTDHFLSTIFPFFYRIQILFFAGRSYWGMDIDIVCKSTCYHLNRYEEKVHSSHKISSMDWPLGGYLPSSAFYHFIIKIGSIVRVYWYLHHAREITEKDGNQDRVKIQTHSQPFGRKDGSSHWISRLRVSCNNMLYLQDTDPRFQAQHGQSVQIAFGLPTTVRLHHWASHRLCSTLADLVTHMATKRLLRKAHIFAL